MVRDVMHRHRIQSVLLVIASISPLLAGLSVTKYSSGGTMQLADTDPISAIIINAIIAIFIPWFMVLFPPNPQFF